MITGEILCRDGFRWTGNQGEIAANALIVNVSF